MRVVPVPQLSDNYAYLLVGSDGFTAVVDGVEPQRVLTVTKQEGLKVSALLTTHHHWDHAGGNAEWAKLFPGIPIYGGIHDNVAACNHPVSDGQEFRLGKDLNIKALETPFHTQGHICYYATEPSSSGKQEPLVFTGDTLFIGGCGRCFVGTPQQMYHSLIEVLARLPPKTRVWCGHEYTVKNLEFAASVDLENPAVRDKLEWAKRQRQEAKPTVPSTIGEELVFNPFMRCHVPAIIAAMGCPSNADPATVLKALRAKKDSFGGASASVFSSLVWMDELRYNPFLRCNQLALQAATSKTDPVAVLAELRRMKDRF